MKKLPGMKRAVRRWYRAGSRWIRNYHRKIISSILVVTFTVTMTGLDTLIAHASSLDQHRNQQDDSLKPVSNPLAESRLNSILEFSPLTNNLNGPANEISATSVNVLKAEYGDLIDSASLKTMAERVASGMSVDSAVSLVTGHSADLLQNGAAPEKIGGPAEQTAVPAQVAAAAMTLGQGPLAAAANLTRTEDAADRLTSFTALPGSVLSEQPALGHRVNAFKLAAGDQAKTDTTTVASEEKTEAKTQVAAAEEKNLKKGEKSGGPSVDEKKSGVVETAVQKDQAKSQTAAVREPNQLRSIGAQLTERIKQMLGGETIQKKDTIGVKIANRQTEIAAEVKNQAQMNGEADNDQSQKASTAKTDTQGAWKAAGEALAKTQPVSDGQSGEETARPVQNQDQPEQTVARTTGSPADLKNEGAASNPEPSQISAEKTGAVAALAPPTESLVAATGSVQTIKTSEVLNTLASPAAAETTPADQPMAVLASATLKNYYAHPLPVEKNSLTQVATLPVNLQASIWQTRANALVNTKVEVQESPAIQPGTSVFKQTRWYERIKSKGSSGNGEAPNVTGVTAGNPQGQAALNQTSALGLQTAPQTGLAVQQPVLPNLFQVAAQASNAVSQVRLEGADAKTTQTVPPTLNNLALFVLKSVSAPADTNKANSSTQAESEPKKESPSSQGIGSYYEHRNAPKEKGGGGGGGCGAFFGSVFGKALMFVVSAVVSWYSMGALAAPMLKMMVVALEAVIAFIPLPGEVAMVMSVLTAAIGGWANGISTAAKSGIAEVVTLAKEALNSFGSVLKTLSNEVAKFAWAGIAKGVLVSALMNSFSLLFPEAGPLVRALVGQLTGMLGAGAASLIGGAGFTQGIMDSLRDSLKLSRPDSQNPLPFSTLLDFGTLIKTPLALNFGSAVLEQVFSMLGGNSTPMFQLMGSAIGGLANGVVNFAGNSGRLTLAENTFSVLRPFIRTVVSSAFSAFATADLHQQGYSSIQTSHFADKISEFVSQFSPQYSSETGKFEVFGWEEYQTPGASEAAKPATNQTEAAGQASPLIVPPTRLEDSGGLLPDFLAISAQHTPELKNEFTVGNTSLFGQTSLPLLNTQPLNAGYSPASAGTLFAGSGPWSASAGPSLGSAPISLSDNLLNAAMTALGNRSSAQPAQVNSGNAGQVNYAALPVPVNALNQNAAYTDAALGMPTMSTPAFEQAVTNSLAEFNNLVSSWLPSVDLTAALDGGAGTLPAVNVPQPLFPTAAAPTEDQPANAPEQTNAANPITSPAPNSKQPENQPAEAPIPQNPAMTLPQAPQTAAPQDKAERPLGRDLNTPSQADSKPENLEPNQVPDTEKSAIPDAGQKRDDEVKTTGDQVSTQEINDPTRVANSAAQALENGRLAASFQPAANASQPSLQSQYSVADMAARKDAVRDQLMQMAKDYLTQSGSGTLQPAAQVTIQTAQNAYGQNLTTLKIADLNMESRSVQLPGQNTVTLNVTRDAGGQIAAASIYANGELVGKFENPGAKTSAFAQDQSGLVKDLSKAETAGDRIERNVEIGGKTSEVAGTAAGAGASGPNAAGAGAENSAQQLAMGNEITHKDTTNLSGQGGQTQPYNGDTGKKSGENAQITFGHNVTADIQVPKMDSSDIQVKGSDGSTYLADVQANGTYQIKGKVVDVPAAAGPGTQKAVQQIGSNYAQTPNGNIYAQSATGSFELMAKTYEAQVQLSNGQQKKIQETVDPSALQGLSKDAQNAAVLSAAALDPRLNLSQADAASLAKQAVQAATAEVQRHQTGSTEYQKASGVLATAELSLAQVAPASQAQLTSMALHATNSGDAALMLKAADLQMQNGALSGAAVSAGQAVNALDKVADIKTKTDLSLQAMEFMKAAGTSSLPEFNQAAGNVQNALNNGPATAGTLAHAARLNAMGVQTPQIEQLKQSVTQAAQAAAQGMQNGETKHMEGLGTLKMNEGQVTLQTQAGGQTSTMTFKNQEGRLTLDKISSADAQGPKMVMESTKDQGFKTTLQRESVMANINGQNTKVDVMMPADGGQKVAYGLVEKDKQIYTVVVNTQSKSVLNVETGIKTEALQNLVGNLQSSFTFENGKPVSLTGEKVKTFENLSGGQLSQLADSLVAATGVSKETSSAWLAGQDLTGKTVYQVGATLYIGSKSSFEQGNYQVVGANKFGNEGSLLYTADYQNGKLDRVSLSDGKTISGFVNGTQEFKITQVSADGQKVSVAAYKNGELQGSNLTLKLFGNLTLTYDAQGNLTKQSMDMLKAGSGKAGYELKQTQGGFTLASRSGAEVGFTESGRLVQKGEAGGSGIQKTVDFNISRSVSLNIAQYGSQTGTTVTYQESVTVISTLQISNDGSLTKSVTYSDAAGNLVERRVTQHVAQEQKTAKSSDPIKTEGTMTRREAYQLGQLQSVSITITDRTGVTSQGKPVSLQKITIDRRGDFDDKGRLARGVQTTTEGGKKTVESGTFFSSERLASGTRTLTEPGKKVVEKGAFGETTGNLISGSREVNTPKQNVSESGKFNAVTGQLVSGTRRSGGTFQQGAFDPKTGRLASGTQSYMKNGQKVAVKGSFYTSGVNAGQVRTGTQTVSGGTKTETVEGGKLISKGVTSTYQIREGKVVGTQSYSATQTFIGTNGDTSSRKGVTARLDHPVFWGDKLYAGEQTVTEKTRTDVKASGEWSLSEGITSFSKIREFNVVEARNASSIQKSFAADNTQIGEINGLRVINLTTDRTKNLTDYTQNMTMDSNWEIKGGARTTNTDLCKNAVFVNNQMVDSTTLIGSQHMAAPGKETFSRHVVNQIEGAVWGANENLISGKTTNSVGELTNVNADRTKSSFTEYSEQNTYASGLVTHQKMSYADSSKTDAAGLTIQQGAGSWSKQYELVGGDAKPATKLVLMDTTTAGAVTTVKGIAGINHGAIALNESGQVLTGQVTQTNQQTGEILTSVIVDGKEMTKPLAGSAMVERKQVEFHDRMPIFETGDFAAVDVVRDVLEISRPNNDTLTVDLPGARASAPQTAEIKGSGLSDKQVATLQTLALDKFNISDPRMTSRINEAGNLIVTIASQGNSDVKADVLFEKTSTSQVVGLANAGLATEKVTSYELAGATLSQGNQVIPRTEERTITQTERIPIPDLGTFFEMDTTKTVTVQVQPTPGEAIDASQLGTKITTFGKDGQVTGEQTMRRTTETVTLKDGSTVQFAGTSVNNLVPTGAGMGVVGQQFMPDNKDGYLAANGYATETNKEQFIQFNEGMTEAGYKMLKPITLVNSWSPINAQTGLSNIESKFQYLMDGNTQAYQTRSNAIGILSQMHEENFGSLLTVNWNGGPNGRDLAWGAETAAKIALGASTYVFVKADIMMNFTMPLILDFSIATLGSAIHQKNMAEPLLANGRGLAEFPKQFANMLVTNPGQAVAFAFGGGKSLGNIMGWKSMTQQVVGFGGMLAANHVLGQIGLAIGGQTGQGIGGLVSIPFSAGMTKAIQGIYTRAQETGLSAALDGTVVKDFAVGVGHSFVETFNAPFEAAKNFIHEARINSSISGLNDLAPQVRDSIVKEIGNSNLKPAEQIKLVADICQARGSLPTIERLMKDALKREIPLARSEAMEMPGQPSVSDIVKIAEQKTNQAADAGRAEPALKVERADAAPIADAPKRAAGAVEVPQAIKTGMASVDRAMSTLVGVSDRSFSNANSVFRAINGARADAMTVANGLKAGNETAVKIMQNLNMAGRENVANFIMAMAAQPGISGGMWKHTTSDTQRAVLAKEFMQLASRQQESVADVRSTASRAELVHYVAARGMDAGAVQAVLGSHAAEAASSGLLAAAGSNKVNQALEGMKHDQRQTMINQLSEASGVKADATAPVSLDSALGRFTSSLSHENLASLAKDSNLSMPEPARELMQKAATYKIADSPLSIEAKTDAIRKLFNADASVQANPAGVDAAEKKMGQVLNGLGEYAISAVTQSMGGYGKGFAEAFGSYERAAQTLDGLKSTLNLLEGMGFKTSAASMRNLVADALFGMAEKAAPAERGAAGTSGLALAENVTALYERFAGTESKERFAKAVQERIDLALNAFEGKLADKSASSDPYIAEAELLASQPMFSQGEGIGTLMGALHQLDRDVMRNSDLGSSLYQDSIRLRAAQEKYKKMTEDGDAPKDLAGAAKELVQARDAFAKTLERATLDTGRPKGQDALSRVTGAIGDRAARQAEGRILSEQAKDILTAPVRQMQDVVAGLGKMVSETFAKAAREIAAAAQAGVDSNSRKEIGEKLKRVREQVNGLDVSAEAKAGLQEIVDSIGQAALRKEQALADPAVHSKVDGWAKANLDPVSQLLGEAEGKLSEQAPGLAKAIGDLRKSNAASPAERPEAAERGRPEMQSAVDDLLANGGRTSAQQEGLKDIYRNLWEKLMGDANGQAMFEKSFRDVASTADEAARTALTELGTADLAATRWSRAATEIGRLSSTLDRQGFGGIARQMRENFALTVAKELDRVSAEIGRAQMGNRPTEAARLEQYREAVQESMHQAVNELMASDGSRSELLKQWAMAKNILAMDLTATGLNKDIFRVLTADQVRNLMESVMQEMSPKALQDVVLGVTPRQASELMAALRPDRVEGLKEVSYQLMKRLLNESEGNQLTRMTKLFEKAIQDLGPKGQERLMWEMNYEKALAVRDQLALTQREMVNGKETGREVALQVPAQRTVLEGIAETARALASELGLSVPPAWRSLAERALTWGTNLRELGRSIGAQWRLNFPNMQRPGVTLNFFLGMPPIRFGEISKAFRAVIDGFNNFRAGRGITLEQRARAELRNNIDVWKMRAALTQAGTWANRVANWQVRTLEARAESPKSVVVPKFSAAQIQQSVLSLDAKQKEAGRHLLEQYNQLSGAIEEKSAKYQAAKDGLFKGRSESYKKELMEAVTKRAEAIESIRKAGLLDRMLEQAGLEPLTKLSDKAADNLLFSMKLGDFTKLMREELGAYKLTAGEKAPTIDLADMSPAGQAEKLAYRQKVIDMLGQRTELAVLNDQGKKIFAEVIMHFFNDPKSFLYNVRNEQLAFLFREAELHYINMELHGRNEALKVLAGEVLQLSMGGGKSDSPLTLEVARRLFMENHPREEVPAMLYQTINPTLVDQIKSENAFARMNAVVITQENAKDIIERGFEAGKVYICDNETAKHIVLEMRSEGMKDGAIADRLQSRLGTVAWDEFHAAFHTTDTIIGATGVWSYLSNQTKEYLTQTVLHYAQHYAQVREMFVNETKSTKEKPGKTLLEMFENIESAPGQEIRGQVRFSREFLEKIAALPSGEGRLNYRDAADAQILQKMAYVLSMTNGQEFFGKLENGKTEYGVGEGGVIKPNTIFGEQVVGALIHIEIFLNGARDGFSAKDFAEKGFAENHAKFIEAVGESLIHRTTDRVSMTEVVNLLGAHNIVAFSGTFEGLEGTLKMWGKQNRLITAEPSFDLREIVKNQGYVAVKIGDELVIMRHDEASNQTVIEKRIEGRTAQDRFLVDMVVDGFDSKIMGEKVCAQIITLGNNERGGAIAEMAKAKAQSEGKTANVVPISKETVDGYIKGKGEAYFKEHGIAVERKEGMLTEVSAKAVIRDMFSTLQQGERVLQIFQFEGSSPEIWNAAMSEIKTEIQRPGAGEFKSWMQERLIIAPKVGEGLNTFEIRAGKGMEKFRVMLHQLELRPLDVTRQTMYRANVTETVNGQETYARARGITGVYLDFNDRKQLTGRDIKAFQKLISEMTNYSGAKEALEFGFRLDKNSGDWFNRFNQMLFGEGPKRNANAWIWNEARTVTNERGEAVMSMLPHGEVVESDRPEYRKEGLMKTILNEVDKAKTEDARITQAGIEKEATTALGVAKGSEKYLQKLAQRIERDLPETMQKNLSLTDFMAWRGGQEKMQSEFLKGEVFSKNALGGSIKVLGIPLTTLLPGIGHLADLGKQFNMARSLYQPQMQLINTYAKELQSQEWVDGHVDLVNEWKAQAADSGMTWFNWVMQDKFGSEWQFYNELGQTGNALTSYRMVRNQFQNAQQEYSRALENIAAITPYIPALDRGQFGEQDLPQYQGGTITYQQRTMGLDQAVNFVQDNLLRAQALSERYGFAKPPESFAVGNGQTVRLDKTQAETIRQHPERIQDMAQQLLSNQPKNNLLVRAGETFQRAEKSIRQSSLLQVLTQPVISGKGPNWLAPAMANLILAAGVTSVLIGAVGASLTLALPFGLSIFAGLKETGGLKIGKAGIGDGMQSALSLAIPALISIVFPAWAPSLLSSMSGTVIGKIFKGIGPQVGLPAMDPRVVLLHERDARMQVDSVQVSRVVETVPAGTGLLAVYERSEAETPVERLRSTLDQAGLDRISLNIESKRQTDGFARLLLAVLDLVPAVAPARSGQVVPLVWTRMSRTTAEGSSEGIQTVDIATGKGTGRVNALAIPKSAAAFLNQQLPEVLVSKASEIALEVAFSEAEVMELYRVFAQDSFPRDQYRTVPDLIKAFILNGPELKAEVARVRSDAMAKGLGERSVNELPLVRAYQMILERLNHEYTAGDLASLHNAASRLENEALPRMAEMAPRVANAENPAVAKLEFEYTFGISYDAYRGMVRGPIGERFLNWLGDRNIRGAAPLAATRVRGFQLIGAGAALGVVGTAATVLLGAAALPLVLGGAALGAGAALIFGGVMVMRDSDAIAFRAEPSYYVLEKFAGMKNLAPAQAPGRVREAAERIANTPRSERAPLLEAFTREFGITFNDYRNLDAKRLLDNDTFLKAVNGLRPNDSIRYLIAERKQAYAILEVMIFLHKGMTALDALSQAQPSFADQAQDMKVALVQDAVQVMRHLQFDARFTNASVGQDLRIVLEPVQVPRWLPGFPKVQLYNGFLKRNGIEIKGLELDKERKLKSTDSAA